MSTDTASLEALVPAQVLGDLMHNWGWLLAQGILLIILGTIGLGMTIWLTMATVFIFGVFLLIGGLVQIVHAFRPSFPSCTWERNNLPKLCLGTAASTTP